MRASGVAARRRTGRAPQQNRPRPSTGSAWPALSHAWVRFPERLQLSRNRMGMLDPMEALDRLGGVAQKQQILMLGVPASALYAAARRGLLFRPMQGWYALPSADAELVKAVRLGG